MFETTPGLFLITDDRLPEDRLVTIVHEACAAGCHAVQLRCKRLTGGPLFALACRLREVTAGHGAALLVNDRIDVALAAGADGVHLPSAGMASGAARRLIGEGRLLGRSIHSAEEIATIEPGRLDYLQFGPVYATSSKLAYGEPQGTGRLAQVAGLARREHGLPVLAVGGIAVVQVREATTAGAAGVAVIGAIMGSTDTSAATVALLAALSGANR